MCEHFPVEVRKKAKEKLTLLNSKGFIARIKNRCVVTGKARGILRKFAMSHTTLRSFARAGSVTGMKKASWLAL
jgi:ribosomal protein S14